jgi:multimeric flavodoxin WrbA
MPKLRVFSEQPDVTLSRAEFEKRFRERFNDPAFDNAATELQRIVDIAWEGYIEYRKSPRTRPAGAEFHDPKFELPIEWLAARAAIKEAEKRQRNAASPSRVLLISASSRSNHTCPGETPKTYRMAKLAQRVLEKKRVEVDFLDMSALTTEYGRTIYPCKACVSTAMPLCNWPCSCYPNHAMGQSADWMHEIYPRFAAAHGVMIVTPVNWYHTSSSLKLMIDRLVCCDGGNPDPTLTHGKDPLAAKKLEMKGWDYPQHLAGRAFSVVVHGDVAGTEDVRRHLCDWLTWIGMIQAGPFAAQDGYIGYYKPYATSHDDYDAAKNFQEDVRNSARSLAAMIKQLRSGKCPPPNARLERARKK